MASTDSNKRTAGKRGAIGNKRPNGGSGRGRRRKGAPRANMSATIQWLALFTVFVLVVVAAFVFLDDSGLGNGTIN